MKQRVLVLGAGGFIGKRLVDALAAGDWATPVAAGRRPSKPGAVETLQVDATDVAQLTAAMRDVSGVVNCVAGDTDTIVNSARAVVAAAAAQARPPRVVHLSSMAVYGDVSGPVDETSPLEAARTPYGTAKLESERASATYPSLVILRPGIVYGPGSSQWSLRIGRLLHSHRLGDLGRGGDGYCNLVHVDDTVRAISSALRTAEAAGGIFNLSLPDPPTWNEYFIRYAKSLGAVPVARITHRRLKVEAKLLAPPLKIAQILLGKLQPRLASHVPEPIPPSLARLFAQEIRMTVQAAETSLGLHWTALDEGLQQTSRWYGSTSGKR